MKNEKCWQIFTDENYNNQVTYLQTTCYLLNLQFFNKMKLHSAIPVYTLQSAVILVYIPRNFTIPTDRLF